MASSNAESYDDREFSEQSFAEPPPQRGCLFYGCLISAILGVLLLIATGLIFFFIYRWVGSVVEEYTATAPRALSKVEVPDERRRAIEERWEQFKTALDHGTATEPLILSAEDINVLISDRPELAGKFYVSIEKDKLRSQVSIPLDELPAFGLTQGRYLNGEAEIKAFLREGILVIVLQSLEVNGKRLPEHIMNSLRAQNLARDAHKNEKTVQEIQKLESIEIQDGRIIIRPKPLTEGAKAASPAGSARAPEPKESPKPTNSGTPAGKPTPPTAKTGDAAPGKMEPTGRADSGKEPTGRGAPGKLDPAGSTSRDPH